MNKFGPAAFLIIIFLAGCSWEDAHIRQSNEVLPAPYIGNGEENLCNSTKLTVDLAREQELQLEVDRGHQPWRLEPVDVAFAAIIAMDQAATYDGCELVSVTPDNAIVECRGRCNYRVHLNRLVRPNGIWTAVEANVTDK